MANFINDNVPDNSRPPPLIIQNLIEISDTEDDPNLSDLDWDMISEVSSHSYRPLTIDLTNEIDNDISPYSSEIEDISPRTPPSLSPPHSTGQPAFCDTPDPYWYENASFYQANQSDFNRRESFYNSV